MCFGTHLRCEWGAHANDNNIPTRKSCFPSPGAPTQLLSRGHERFPAPFPRAPFPNRNLPARQNADRGRDVGRLYFHDSRAAVTTAPFPEAKSQYGGTLGTSPGMNRCGNGNLHCTRQSVLQSAPSAVRFALFWILPLPHVRIGDSRALEKLQR